MRDVIVIGAGLAGLSAAFWAHRAGRDVVLLEASSRVGGLVHTSHVDGAVIEHGPETLQPIPEVLDLIEALDLVDEVVAPSPASHTRWVVRDGGLVPLPAGPADLFRSPLWSRVAALRMLAEPLVPRGSAPETVHDFATRRFGPAAARELVNPFVAGVFAGDPRALEVASSFADLVQMERDAGSVVRGGIRRARARAASRPAWAPRVMLTFHGGMQQLPDRLAERLGDRVQRDWPVHALTPVPGGWRVDGPAGSETARRVVLACGLPASARLLGEETMTVPRAPIASVHLGWHREAVAAPPAGFGWLAPSHQRRDVLGGIYVSSVFPGHAPGHVLHRVMIGGTRDPEQVTRSDVALVDHAREVVRTLCGIDAEPVITDVSRAPVGIPQYPMGHADRVAAWQTRWPGISLLGWDVTGVGASHGIRAGAALSLDT